MLLTYSKDRFVDDIKARRKIHTIREDRTRRWRAGMKIQHWRGNPRNVKNNPYWFMDDECNGVEEIVITRFALWDIIEVKVKPDDESVIDWVLLNDSEIEELASNDGLTMQEFREWFVPEPDYVYTGRIIHFTEKRYHSL